MVRVRLLPSPRRKEGRSAAALFVNLAQCFRFDMVSRKLIEKALEQIGAPQALRRMVWPLYMGHAPLRSSSQGRGHKQHGLVFVTRARHRHQVGVGQALATCTGTRPGDCVRAASSTQTDQIAALAEGPTRRRRTSDHNGEPRGLWLPSELSVAGRRP